MPDAVKRLAQDAAIERRVVGDHDPPLQAPRQLGQDLLEVGGGVDHRLGDAGEALDAAPQRGAAAHDRAPALVQLAAADEHGADLGHLAGVAAQPVGLGVDDEKLGADQRVPGQGVICTSRHACVDTPGAGRDAILTGACDGPRAASDSPRRVACARSGIDGRVRRVLKIGRSVA